MVSQVTPIYIQDQWPNIDWYQYLRIWERLPAHMRRVADLVGIEEAFLARAVRGRILTRTDQHRQSLAVHRRFFAALALQDLVHEVPLNVVAWRYGANRGMLQSLQGSAATFAGMVTVFCEKLGWTNMELLLSQFQSRLSFGVERELCDLVRISLLNAARARMLYNAGYRTIASVAAVPPSEIENILHNAAPFVSGLKRGQETEIEVRERSEARVIWVAGRRGLTEGAAAKLIVSEAKQLLQVDVAQLGIQWRPPETAENDDGSGIRGEAHSSSAADVRPSSPSARPLNAFQNAVDLRAAGRREAIPSENSKTEVCAGESSTGRLKPNMIREAVEGEMSAKGSCGQKIASLCRPENQIVGLRLVGGKEPPQPGANFIKPLSNVKAPTPTNRVFAGAKLNSGVDFKKTADVAPKLNYEDCVTASKSLLSHAEKKPLRNPCIVTGGSCVVPSITTLGNETIPRSRTKRRSPVREIPEPQEKLKRKETTEMEEPKTTYGPKESRNTSGQKESRNTSGPEESRGTSGPKESRNTTGSKESRNTSGPEESRGISGPKESRNTSGPKESMNTSPVLEVSADSKLCNEAQSVSMELYSEPFEGEELAEQQKPVDLVHHDNNVMLDSQELTGCSLSDTCLMECDIMVEDGARKFSEHPGPESNAKASHENVMHDQKDIITTVKPNDRAVAESQDIIGEYDTQPRLQATGEVHAERSFEFSPSLASPVPQAPRQSAADDVASTSATNSFSLRLSSSDGYSDLSSLAMIELMEKEAEITDLQKEAETAAVQLCEANFTKIKHLKSSESANDNDEKPPAKKMPRNETPHDVEFERSEIPDSEVVPSTPPRDKKLTQADFKTKTSATPLSTRKRPSPRRGSPYAKTTDEGLAIIDVAGHEQVFNMFLKEWRSQTRFSLAVACERVLDNAPRIGGRFTNVPTAEGTSRGLKVEGEDLVVVGIAVSWGGKDAYYVSLKEHAQSEVGQPDDSQAESAVDTNLTLTRRVYTLKSIVQFLTDRGRFMVCFDVKEHFKVR